MTKPDMFFQSLTIDGEELGTMHISEGTYIERADLTGPKLMLKLSDRYKTIVDDYGLKNGSVLELGIGDVEGRGDALFKDRFVVGSNWTEGNHLHIEALQEDIHRIKQIQKKPLFLVDKTPLQILQQAFPGKRIDADSFDLKSTYHVLGGSTLAVILKRMAQDYGAALWLNRGTVHFKALSGALTQSEAYRFEFQRSGGENPLIERYDRYQPDSTVTRRGQGNYVCWNPVDGLIRLGNANTTKHLVATHENHLANHGLSQLHVMECLLAGNGQFEPWQLVSLELNRLTVESALDESVPGQQVILGVRHFQRGMSYIASVELGVIHDANQSNQ